jgi:hypothetical protein
MPSKHLWTTQTFTAFLFSPTLSAQETPPVQPLAPPPSKAVEPSPENSLEYATGYSRRVFLATAELLVSRLPLVLKGSSG